MSIGFAIEIIPVPLSSPPLPLPPPFPLPSPPSKDSWIYSMYHCCLSGTRFDDGAGGDNEVQRTMLELINQLDGFDPRGNIKVLMATNR